MQLDEALRYLGNFGRYQTLVYVLYCLVGCVFSACQMMAMVFIADKPAGYRCTAPLAAGDAGDVINGSYFANVSANRVQDGINSSVGFSDVAECFVNSSETGDSTACTEWEYYFEYGEKTAVSDFDLVCDRAVLGSTAQSIFFGGVLVGSLVCGALSDILGRKTVLVGAMFLEGVFGICIAFAPSYTVFVALWFFVGAMEQGLNLTGFVYVMELFTPEKRTLAGCLTGVAWGVGVVLITPYAYLLRDWRHMEIAVSATFLVVAPLSLWIVSESVRWLVSKGRTDAAEKVLHRIARLNNIKAPERFLKDNDVVLLEAGEPRVKHAPSDVNENTDDDDTEPNDKGVGTEVKIDTEMRAWKSADKFRLTEWRKTPLLFRNAFIMCFSWLVSSMVYYGMSLNSSNLAGDKYLNFFLIGLVEVPGYLVLYFLIEWWGRRPSLSMSHFIAGISSIICACLPPTTEEGADFTPAILAFALIGKFFITISFAVDYVYGSEIFPTSIRNMGVGVSSFSARIGGMLAPFVVYLADVSPYIPLNVFGIASVLAAALVLLLPETAKKPLPETVADGEWLARSAVPPRLPRCLQLGRQQRFDTNGYEAAKSTA
ncbi:organic cation transporter protein-like [Acanthaster planci]|uniref:Organic cation transporter protein-like n=1 Tax=Acanthaster planci TaxID=133434 RepID=A0A8B7ZSA6_ACAPL|nr:organic cation transporter protein-like [Acanthaster planci]